MTLTGQPTLDGSAREDGQISRAVNHNNFRHHLMP